MPLLPCSVLSARKQRLQQRLDEERTAALQVRPLQLRIIGVIFLLLKGRREGKGKGKGLRPEASCTWGATTHTSVRGLFGEVRVRVGEQRGTQPPQHLRPGTGTCGLTSSCHRGCAWTLVGPDGQLCKAQGHWGRVLESTAREGASTLPSPFEYCKALVAATHQLAAKGGRLCL